MSMEIKVSGDLSPLEDCGVELVPVNVLRREFLAIVH
jgi:hypothetical protein